MDHLTLAAVRSAARSLALVAEAPRDAPFAALRARVSLARIIERAAEGRYFDGSEGEYLGEVARRNGKRLDEARPVLDWELLATRADTVGSAAGGGYLVPGAVLPAADALRPTTICVQLGAQVVPVNTANYSLPRQTGVATAYWLSNEASIATESDQTFGQVGLSPKTCAAYTEVSRQLLMQSDADQAIPHRPPRAE